jgi:DNA-binding XRE family transcriptional regulator
MPYHPKVVAHIKKLPMTNMGAALGRWAIYYDLPVMKVAVALGVTRQSVYNWMKGGEIFDAYKPRVQTLIKIMEHAHATNKTSEYVWRTACQEFKITTT